MPPTAVPPDARAAVLAWYDVRGRALPFRASRDPYAILVSEVMAQQTQIARVAGAWSTFLERFPTVRALADATPADVLRAWRGMGYDRRALNLRRTARAIVEVHGGEVPRDVAALEALPGIGPYTARAVASIAFGRPVGAVDTNVRRVLGRSLAGGVDALAPGALQAAADASVPQDRAADWTHALMDVGATLCRGRVPACEPCPLRRWCAYAGRSGEAAAPDTDRATGAGVTPEPRPARRPSIPFTATTRWLRGRIVDHLRATDGDAWATLPPAIGEHDGGAIDGALAALARDGVVELEPESAAGDRRARLATR